MGRSGRKDGVEAVISGGVVVGSLTLCKYPDSSDTWVPKANQQGALDVSAEE